MELPLVLVAACALGCSGDGPAMRGERWYAADRLFSTDPRWVGGDGAFSVDLQDGRVLWLFGDSFIAQRPFDETGADFVNNTCAIQHGTDPTTSPIRFYWRTSPTGQPIAFAPGGDDYWLWPEHGVRLGRGLLLFYEVVRVPSGEEPGPGAYEGLDWTAFFIADASGDPSQWELREVATPDTQRRLLGEALIVEPPWLYTFGNDDDRHPVYLARWPLAEAAAGELSSLEYWCGGSWCTGAPSRLIAWGAPELSVHFDAARDEYLMVHSAAVGATTLAVRSAPALEGPWSDARDIVRPPESFRPHTPVYAGKAHPMLDGGDLVITFVASDTYLPVFVKAYFE